MKKQPDKQSQMMFYSRVSGNRPDQIKPLNAIIDEHWKHPKGDLASSQIDYPILDENHVPLGVIPHTAKSVLNDAYLKEEPGTQYFIAGTQENHFMAYAEGRSSRKKDVAEASRFKEFETPLVIEKDNIIEKNISKKNLAKQIGYNKYTGKGGLLSILSLYNFTDDNDIYPGLINYLKEWYELTEVRVPEPYIKFFEEQGFKDTGIGTLEKDHEGNPLFRIYTYLNPKFH